MTPDNPNKPAEEAKARDRRQERIDVIKRRVEKFAYGLGQADFDIKFLLRYIEELQK